VGDRYSPAAKWRGKACYLAVRGANLYTGLHRESGSATCVVAVGASTSIERSSPVGVPIRLLAAPGEETPGAKKPRVRQLEHHAYPLGFVSRRNKAGLEILKSAQYAFASRSGRVSAEQHSGNGRTVYFLLEGPQTINDGQWASRAFKSMSPSLQAARPVLARLEPASGR
jgi:hypothetical protein